MAEHTPGTWVAKPHQFGGCWWVDTLHGSIQVSMKTLFKDDMDEANARFIAAAPDMEKALEGLLQLMSEIDATTYVDDNGEDAFYPAVHAAYEAIAKAKGETPNA